MLKGRGDNQVAYHVEGDLAIRAEGKAQDHGHQRQVDLGRREGRSGGPGVRVGAGAWSEAGVWAEAGVRAGAGAGAWAGLG